MPRSKSASYSALYEACISGDVERVRRLLAADPDVEKEETRNGTWLHTAASMGHAALVAYWLDRGIPVNQNVPGYSQSDGLKTPLHLAVNETVIRLLVSRGADLNPWARYGGTPLHNAVIASVKIGTGPLKALLDLGADSSIVDKDGKTPLALAIQHKRNACEQILREANAPLEGRKIARTNVQERAAPIDLREDARQIRDLLKGAIERFARENSREQVTAVALAASGIEGFVMVAFDITQGPGDWNHYSSPWDASHTGYATNLPETLFRGLPHGTRPSRG